ncbi:PREDICTED: RNA pseudouridine synthase 5 isoform X1 [Lupinus angustifolius]|uniref:RNA pseudouridine synthase 5 isoform X1 n=1 Tax=Lupinus angustifolius TaxID=3871 RepID=UPI00092EB054|nr:PREDICTED: RNA pseudouridine synthase 5 isoform X1 [Lupinus angustifolius]
MAAPATPNHFGVPWPQFNDGLSYHDTVRSSDSGLSLIEFYSTKYKSSAPLQGWLQRINSEQIIVDGSVVTDPNTLLRVGSKLVYHRLPWKEPDAPYMIEVLYEDGDIIALNKPSGLQVLPGGLFQQRTVLTQLQWQANKQGTFEADQRPHPVPVHRLGRGTSGILLCAKSKLAKTCLASYFADGTSQVGGKSSDSSKEPRKIAKIYRALVSGIVDNDKVVIDQPIGVVKYPGVAKGLYVASQSGKPALSVVNILERDLQRNSTLVQVQIQSGRPHQIRIHLSFVGHPLLGDPLYAVGGQPKCLDCDFVDESFAEDGGYQRPSKPVPGDCGYHLHAHQLALTHPITNEVIEIIAPLPSILQTAKEAGEIGITQQTTA